MTTEERISWMKTVREGDKVCYKVPGLGGPIIVSPVLRVTPTGMVRTSDDRLFNPKGRATYGTSWVYLEPYTEAIAAKVSREKLVVKAEHSIFVLSSRAVIRNIPSELLEELVALEVKISQSLLAKELK